MPDDNPKTQEDLNALNTIEQEQPTQGNAELGRSLEDVQPMTMTPKKRKITKKTLIIIVAAVILLLSAGAVLVYKFWYQNPDKVVADALSNALQADSYSYSGTMSGTSSGAEMKITFDGEATRKSGAVNVKLTSDMNGQDITLSGKALIAEEGDVYVQLGNVGELASSLFGGMGMAMLPPSFSSVIDIVDGQWIRIDADDLTQYADTDNQKMTSCIDSIKLLQANGDAQDELAKLYREHSFIDIDESLDDATINGVDSLGYRLTINQQVLKDFSDKARDIPKVEILKACESDDETELNGEPASLPSFAVYISRWGHELTQVKVSDIDSADSQGELVLNTDFNTDVSVQVPQDAMTFEELQAQIEAAMMAYQEQLIEEMQASENQALERLQDASEQAELAA